MRFFKSFSITIVVLLSIFIVTYSARISIVNKAIEEHLSLYQIKVDCLDISLVSSMNILVNKLCIQSAKADIEINDMVLAWQVFPKFKITNINVKKANVKGTEHLFSNIKLNSKKDKHHNNNQTISQLLSEALQPHINQIKKFKLPININIAELSYLPFLGESKSKKMSIKQNSPYFASFSVINSKPTFSLRNADKVTLIKGELNIVQTSVENKNNTEFSIILSSELNLLQDFVNRHQLPLTAKFQKLLADNKISGYLKTVINYQADSISMLNQIPNLTIASEYGIENSGAYKLKATLDIKSQLDLMASKVVKSATSKKPNKGKSEIALTFKEQNVVSLEYSQPHFFSLLEQYHVSPTIISLLKENPFAQLAIISKDNATLTLNKKQLNLSNIEISAINNERVHHAKLEDISLAAAKNIGNKVSNYLTIEKFTIDSKLQLTDLAKYTTKPLAIHLEGSLQQTEKKTNLDLHENSLITAKKIVLTKQQPNASDTTKNNAFIKLHILATAIEGNIQLKADKTFNSNIRVTSKASQLDITKVAQINSFKVISEIKGGFDDIQINATADADGVNIANISIVGPALTPQVQLMANELKLTDLLSLNIQLPTKIELIDGLLNYKVSGHLTDLSQWDKNIFNASISLTSVSGEVEGIWLQELNWQQGFTLFDSKVNTLPNNTENLTVALIDTPTPISKLSVNTHWTFNKRFKFSANKLNADVLGGSFSVPKIEWPFKHGHSANVQLNSIDLEQVLALDKKQGIVVTGDISGQLPVTFDGEKYIIENGELHNISNGLIQVRDNPAVNELKKNNTQLQLAFDALQNLHYHQLSSAVSMADDGYMLLETVIKGRNPDIDNDVNLNLNLNYDLLGLLESMSITQRFENNIIKGLQKDKE